MPTDRRGKTPQGNHPQWRNVEGGPRSYGYVRNPVSWVDPLGLADGDPLPPDAVVHRIGGGGVNNLGLSSRDLASDKPGLSVLQDVSKSRPGHWRGWEISDRSRPSSCETTTH
jgi:uncharacterized protein RhaS with RHS repeats